MDNSNNESAGKLVPAKERQGMQVVPVSGEVPKADDGPISIEMQKLGVDGKAKETTGAIMSPAEAAQVKTNHCYVMFFTITFLCGSTLQGGWAVAECGQVGLVLDKKLGWNAFTDNKDEQRLLNNLTIVTVLVPLGFAIGSYAGGALLPRFGPRKLIIAVNVICLLFNILKLIESTAVIMLARLALGTALGVALVCLSKAINDTVPAQNAPQYGAFVNGGFGIGICLSNFMGLLIPLDNGDEGDVQKMLDDQNWRLVFGFPILLNLYTVIVLVFFIKHESIIQLLQSEDQNSELLQAELKKVYSIPSTVTYEQLVLKLRGEIQFSDPVPCTVIQGLSQKQYRRASINGMLLACFQ